MRKSMGSLLAIAAIAAGQQSPPEPTFLASTELVQVSVVATDKQSRPITDLRREEFQLFDNGAPQEVRLFVVDTAEASPLAPDGIASNGALNTFTNRIVAPTGAHSGYSVILIDNLFSGSDPTGEEGSALSRVRALQMLRSIPTGERIAIYAPGQKLRIICEFTSDRDLLERQLRKWKPTPSTPVLEPRPSLQSPMNPGMSAPGINGLGTSGHGPAEMARIDEVQRAAAGDAEMDAVADHLAGIPGRKNLIWLANKFPIGPRALQHLTRAGVSIYPVDIDGVCRLCPERPKQLMDGLAALTGGVAYYGRNDLDVAIREAMDDGRVSYTLGFYPSGEDHAPQIHRIAVKVSRPGVDLRYGTSYQPHAPPPVSATTGDLVQALNRPIDATGILIKASATKVRDSLNIEARLSVESLGLVADRSLWTGRIDIAARFTTADGIVASDVFAQTLNLNLNQTTYDAVTRSGLAYEHEFRIPLKAVELKLLFANPASGKIGTLTIPLSAVKTDKTNAR